MSKKEEEETLNNTVNNKVLLVDDDTLGLKALSKSIQRLNPKLEILTAQDKEEALNLIKETPKQISVSIVDLTLDPSIGPQSGLDLISDILKIDSSIRVIVLTSHEASEYGIQALHKGAASFIEKPANTEHLIALIKDCNSYVNLKRSYKELQKNSKAHSKILGLNSKSEKMRETLEQALFASKNRLPILILGETGTGKGVLARQIHKESELKGRFIRFQPNFTGADLIASELFGHEKGSFTGANLDRKGLIEEANKGTLFIDEVDMFPKETQVTLLNVLQEKTFRKVGSSNEKKSEFRLITASNIDRNELEKFDKLRQDFFHRVAHVVIQIPPLRERKEDIEALSYKFMQRLIDSENLNIQGINQDAISMLRNFSWPGNIRQLQAIIESATYKAAYRGKNFIDEQDIDIGKKSAEQKQDSKESSFREKVKNYELNLINEALEKTNNNQSKAAELLKLDRSSFRRILSRKVADSD